MIGQIGSSRVLAGRYLLERVLGTGGMAAVHVALDRRLGRRVAVKVVPVAVTPDDERDRFVREARTAAGLSHPNAVSVFDAGEADGFLYIVMELIHGATLAEILAERGQLTVEEATSVASSLLAALSEAHAAGIVHRDVKPSNVMVAHDGSVKLLDFGIARRLDDLAEPATRAGEVLGTPKYLAPERIEGKPTSPATDVYGVGIVLFEMLAGEAPFVRESPVATAVAHTNEPVPDVSSIRDDVPSGLAAVVCTALAKEPARRFADAAAMQRALSESLNDATTIIPSAEPTQPLAAGELRGWTPPWWFAGVAATVLAGLVTWNFAGDVFSFITSGEPAERPLAAASPTTSSTVATTSPPTTTTPTTLDGVIAAFRANPEAYGRHTPEIIDELVKIQRGDNPAERAAALLDSVARWVDRGETTPSAHALLEPVLAPLIALQGPDTGDDGGGDGGGNGHGNGRGNGHDKGSHGGNGNGNGRGNGGGHGHGHGNGHGRGNGHGNKG